MKDMLQFANNGEKLAQFSFIKRVMALLMVFLFAIVANASTYCYLEFTSTTGVKTAFSVTNLTLTVQGNHLQVTNHDGTVDLLLTDLASMQFSSTNCTTDLECIINADAPIHVLTVSGVSLGIYSSLVDASQSLSAGAYVISNGTQSQTIIVK